VESGIEVVCANRETFQSHAELESFVGSVDCIVHLAGVTRGEDSEIARVNVELAESLVSAMVQQGRQPHCIYASTIHALGDTVYGRAKRRVGEILRNWAEDNGAPFSNVVLPHVFGECGRPYHNSVVSTFCQQLAVGDKPEVHNDSQLCLLHAQEVAELILELAHERTSNTVYPGGTPIKVSELLERLQGLNESYSSNVIPNLDDPLDLQLFNTLRSYFYPQHYPVAIPQHSDYRGALFESVKTQHRGQVFLSTTFPGITRGDHFHFAKVERFVVVRGQADIEIRRLFDDHVVTFRVDGSEPVIVDIPTLHTHSITNVGPGELLTMFWADNFPTFRTAA
jgi:UDP-2-acetamido-2,6-beta-L-arabino-hexul-4-ose reductase